MGRPLTAGLSYFPVNVDIFDDTKLLFVADKYGDYGELIAFKLLTWIYRNGYYLEWNDEMLLLFTKKAFINVKSQLVKDVVNELIHREFFDQHLYKKYAILTSRGIQKRWKFIINSLKRKANIDEKYNLLLIPLQNQETPASTELTPASTELTPASTELTPASTELTPLKEKKGKEKKGKERKERKGYPKSSLEERALKLKNEVNSFSNKYSISMLNDFFRYWSEPNKSKTKMRYEMQSTWELSRRLGTWKRNEEAWGKKKGRIEVNGEMEELAQSIVR